MIAPTRKQLDAIKKAHPALDDHDARKLWDVIAPMGYRAGVEAAVEAIDNEKTVWWDGEAAVEVLVWANERIRNLVKP